MARAAAAPARHAPAAPPARVPRRRPEAPGRVSPRPVPRGAAVLDALLRGRAWIALVFVLLAGIVFFNVDLLRMNREIAVTGERASAVKRENARLRTDLARLGSSERIQRVAAERGLVLPAPGEVRYLRSDPPTDARRAAARMKVGEAGGPAVPAAQGGVPAAPAEEPAAAAEEPGAPAEQPAAPAEQPGVPAAQPGVPAAQPGAPAAQPSPQPPE